MPTPTRSRLHSEEVRNTVHHLGPRGGKRVFRPVDGRVSVSEEWRYNR